MFGAVDLIVAGRFAAVQGVLKASFQCALPYGKPRAKSPGPNIVPRFALCVIPLGLEPKTHSLEGCCSIQLSYGTIKTAKIVIIFLEAVLR